MDVDQDDGNFDELDNYCEFCDKYLDDFDEFEFHNHLYHTNECLTCKKNFSTIKMLEIHNLETHDNLYKLKLDNKQALFQCIHDSCDQTFDMKRDRFNHLISVHNYNKSELISFIDLNYDNSEIKSVNRHHHQIPAQICFGDDNVQPAFNKRIQKIAKRKHK